MSKKASLYKASGRLNSVQVILLILSPIVISIICIGIGRVSISVSDIFRAFGSLFSSEYEVSPVVASTIFSYRLPRILLALLCGAGLSVSGCVFQSLFANPLATPDTLGVASGASFGAALGILFGFSLFGIQMMSLVFGCVAVFVTWLCAFGGKRGMNSIVLSGIIIGSLFSALMSLVKYVADTESQLPAITYWLMGSLGSAGYETMKFGAPPIIISLVILLLLRWRLNILPLSEDEARTSGINLWFLRIVTAICATLITASCVSMCGQIGWVGLLVPHFCRMLFGTNHMAIIPASVSFGSAFVVVVDTLARSVSASEIPISILTAIIGAPFFILLMRKSGGWRF